MNGFVLVFPFPPPPEGGGGGGGLRQFPPLIYVANHGWKQPKKEKGKQQHPFSPPGHIAWPGAMRDGGREKRLLVRQTRISQTICTAKKKLEQISGRKCRNCIFLAQQEEPPQFGKYRLQHFLGTAKAILAKVLREARRYVLGANDRSHKSHTQTSDLSCVPCLSYFYAAIWSQRNMRIKFFFIHLSLRPSNYPKDIGPKTFRHSLIHLFIFSVKPLCVHEGSFFPAPAEAMCARIERESASIGGLGGLGGLGLATMRHALCTVQYCVPRTKIAASLFPLHRVAKKKISLFPHFLYRVCTAIPLRKLAGKLFFLGRCKQKKIVGYFLSLSSYTLCVLYVARGILPPPPKYLSPTSFSVGMVVVWGRPRFLCVRTAAYLLDGKVGFISLLFSRRREKTRSLMKRP